MSTGTCIQVQEGEPKGSEDNRSLQSKGPDQRAGARGHVEGS